ncbi:MAG: cytochrome c4 [Betaproteobacteria bacterium]|nr:cytochrome c4 [Betaproteobacteria bacterium]
MNRFLLLLAGLFSATVAMSTFAADHAAAPPKADPAKGQQIAATVCAACHNADGNSTISANPKLAGQHAEYLLKQMENFKAEGGKPPLRTNAVMNAMIGAYSVEQMRDIAAYFSEQTQKGEMAKNRDTIEYGQRLYRAGDQTKGLPACASCHGPTGAGIPVLFPRIGGQFSEYIEAQLRNFRAGDRANDPNKMMRMVAIKMTDAEIKAVSDYVAGLR